MTGGGATGGSSSAAAEGTAVDALGRAVGDLRMGTMGTPLDSPPGELGAAEDVRHREHLWQQRDCPAPRRALRRGTRSFSYQYQERLRKAAEADAAARRAGRSAVFREGDIANHRDGDSDDDTNDERERALEDQGVFLEMEGGSSDSDDDASKYNHFQIKSIVNNFTVYFFFNMYFSI